MALMRHQTLQTEKVSSCLLTNSTVTAGFSWTGLSSQLAKFMPALHKGLQRNHCWSEMGFSQARWHTLCLIYSIEEPKAAISRSCLVKHCHKVPGSTEVQARKIMQTYATAAQTSNFWRRHVFLCNFFFQIFIVLSKKWRMAWNKKNHHIVVLPQWHKNITILYT